MGSVHAVARRQASAGRSSLIDHTRVLLGQNTPVFRTQETETQNPGVYSPPVGTGISASCVRNEPVEPRIYAALPLWITRVIT